jgi:tellurite resistance-related uncharacterized protein
MSSSPINYIQLPTLASNNTATLYMYSIIATFAIVHFVHHAVACRSQKNKRLEDNDGMPLLPQDVEKYSQLPKSEGKVFTANSIPRGLLNRHSTQDGTWGVLKILKGSLEYKTAPRGNTMIKETENEDDNIIYPTQFVLDPTTRNGIIEPRRFHKVQAASEDLEFIVEFYRLPGTGPVQEKRD